jgi:hypothetical protein
MLNEGRKSNKNFYTVSVRTFAIPFYYGSAKIRFRYGKSSGSGFATMLYWTENLNF